MKLLLDEMHDPAVATALGEAGHDVVAVTELEDLRGQTDDELLTAAHQERRAIITENIQDFMLLHTRWLVSGREHSGVVFTHPQRFPRGARDHRRRLIRALTAFVTNAEQPQNPSWTWWLDDPKR